MSILFIWNKHGAVNSSEEVKKIQEFIQDRCTQPETINRHFLQQSWFYDDKFENLAGAFGNNSFSLYVIDNQNKEIHGAFCIDGNNLEVTYYERRFVPMKIGFSSVNYGVRLTPITKDTLIVKKLNSKHMILISKNDGIERIFYRKN